MAHYPFIEFKSFTGLNNVDDHYSLAPTEFSAAMNVDIDNKGLLSRRRGYYRTLVGTYRNLDPNGSGLVVKDDTRLAKLTLSNGSFSVAELKTGLTAGAQMVYCNTGDRTFCTNGFDIGYVFDSTWHDLSAVDAGEPKEEVQSYLRASRMTMPSGHLIEHYNGRIYVYNDTMLYFSDSLAYHRCHKTHGGIMRPKRGTMLSAVNDGLWLSDDGIFFMSGGDVTDSSLKKVAPYSAIEGTAIKVPGEKLGIEGIRGECIVFTTHEGICVGGPGGFFKNITHNKYRLPSAITKGSSLYMNPDGSSRIITSLT